MKTMTSPAATSNETPLMTGRWPNDFTRPRTSRIGAATPSVRLSPCKRKPPLKPGTPGGNGIIHDEIDKGYGQQGLKAPSDALPDEEPRFGQLDEPDDG